MKYANEILGLWYMSVATFIIIATDDSTVYITFLGLHVAIVPLYKWLQKREDRLNGHTKESTRIRS